MLNIILLFYLVFFSVFNALNPQNKSGVNTSNIVKLHGQVLNSESKNPVQVKAVITYKTLPYGSDFGITEIKEGNQSSYQFYLRTAYDYIIQAKAPGFAAQSKMVGNLDETALTDIPFDFLLQPARPGDLLAFNNLIFDKGKYDLKESAYEELEDLITTLNINPGMIIRLEGHTDVLGGRKSNLELAENRIEEVKTYLILHGIAPKRIREKAMGEKDPIVTSGSEDERDINRRVEVRIIEM